MNNGELILTNIFNLMLAGESILNLLSSKLFILNRTGDPVFNSFNITVGHDAT